MAFTDVYNGIKLTIRKSVLLMKMSMLVLYNVTARVLFMDSDVRPVYAVLLSCTYSMICDNC